MTMQPWSGNDLYHSTPCTKYQRIMLRRRTRRFKQQLDNTMYTPTEIKSSPKPCPNRFEKALALEEMLVAEIKRYRQSRIKVAYLLWQMKKDELWRELDFNSFPEYCASPTGLQLEWHDRTVQDYTRTIQAYMDLDVPAKELQQINFSNLSALAPVVNESNLDLVLSDATALGNRDVRKRKKSGVYEGTEQVLEATKEPEYTFTNSHSEPPGPRRASFTIFGEPASKANSRRLVKINGRPASIKSQKALDYVKAFQVQCPKLKALIAGDVAVTITIYYASRRPDLDESVILDAMQDLVYANDRQVKEKHVFWGGIDKDNPRAEIEVAERVVGNE